MCCWKFFDASGLTPEQLFERLKPLLRQGGLLASSVQLARIKQNLNSVSWELAEQWRLNPRLGEREVEFSEFLATKLCNTLRALDRKENPHLYDVHGAYARERETLDLNDIDEKYFPFHPSTPASPSPTQATWRPLLSVAGRHAAIEQPSVNALIHNVFDVEAGKTTTPYMLARGEGLSTDDARCHPATGRFVAIKEFIAEYTATAVPTVMT